MSDLCLTTIAAHPSNILKSWLLWAALLFSWQLCASGLARAAEELIAVATDVKESACIEHYEILLDANLEHNRLDLQSTCTVRNQSDGTLTHINFDLLAAEQAYGAKVAVGRIWADDGPNQISCQFSHVPTKQPRDMSQSGTRQFPRIVRVTLPSAMGPTTERRIHLEYTITIPGLEADVSSGLIAVPPEGGERVFLDGILQPAEEQPASTEAVIAKLTYARLLSATTIGGRKAQLRQLLEGITGVRFEIDAGLNRWREWWQEHRTSFQPAQPAHRLSPAGVLQSSALL